MTQVRSRQMGVLYLLYFVTAVLGGLLVRGFAVHGDAATTAHNFATHEVAVRASQALGLVSTALYLALTACFYDLFRVVSRRFAMAATCLSVAACAIQAISAVLLAPLLMPVPVGPGAEAFRLLAEATLAIHAQALAGSLVLFGGFDILIGILILRSSFLPHIFGMMMGLAGLGWLSYLWPPLAASLARVVLPLGFLAEFAQMIGCL